MARGASLAGAIETLVEVILDHAGGEIALRESASRGAHKLFVFAEWIAEIERIVSGEGTRGFASLRHLLFSSALLTNAGSRTQEVFRSNRERARFKRFQRPAAGAAGWPLGVPKKRKKSDFGLMTMRVSPPFNPVS